MRPIALEPNLPETFYAGSGRLAEFRGRPVPPRPEDWVASCTTRFGSQDEGLSRLPDGTLLRDAITADPIGWLGDCPGDGPGILVKLLDAGQRLPVHVHPDGRFARHFLTSPYGKTEAWIILDASPEAVVHLGFRRTVTMEELTDWVITQDVDALLQSLNRLPVSAGDVLLCPAGVPHAIGEGILLLELQEPADLSVLLEHDGFPVSARDAMLGMATDRAISCVDRSRYGAERIRALHGGGDSVLPAAADPYFGVTRAGGGFSGHGFAVVVVTRGAGRLVADDGAVPVRRGATIAVPHAAGTVRVEGDVDAYWCTPPAVPSRC